MTLPEKEFVPAWMLKALSQQEQSQVDTDSDTDFGMNDAENEIVLPLSPEASARQAFILNNFKDCAKKANDFIHLDANKFVTAITLLQTFRRTKASLDTYEDMIR